MPNITQTADGQASHNANFDQLLGHVGTTTDTPTNQTKAAYPETKVVLVERDEEKWLKSIQMQFSEALKPAGRYVLRYTDTSRSDWPDLKLWGR